MVAALLPSEANTDYLRPHLHHVSLRWSRRQGGLGRSSGKHVLHTPVE